VLLEHIPVLDRRRALYALPEHTPALAQVRALIAPRVKLPRKERHRAHNVALQ